MNVTLVLMVDDALFAGLLVCSREFFDFVETAADPRFCVTRYF